MLTSGNGTPHLFLKQKKILLLQMRSGYLRQQGEPAGVAALKDPAAPGDDLITAFDADGQYRLLLPDRQLKSSVFEFVKLAGCAAGAFGKK